MDYVGQDNTRHRPVMIHRALFGTVERFFALLVEHYAGAFPTWLSPVQVRVLPVRDDHVAYAREVRALLSAAGVRAEADDAGELSVRESAVPNWRSCRMSWSWATPMSPPRPLA